MGLFNIHRTGMLNPLPSGGSLPTPTAVTFDGTNDYLNLGAALTGAADTQYCSMYFKFSTSSATTQRIFNSTRVTSYINTSGNIVIQLYAPATLVNLTTSGVTVNGGSTHELFMSYDGNVGDVIVYIDSTDVTGTPSAENTGTLDMDPADWYIGSTTSGTQLFNGDITRLCFWQDYAPDISNSTVRSNMADETQASTLGDNIVDIYGSTTDWNNGTNQGGGGTFTMNGSVT